MHWKLDLKAPAVGSCKYNFLRFHVSHSNACICRVRRSPLYFEPSLLLILHQPPRFLWLHDGCFAFHRPRRRSPYFQERQNACRSAARTGPKTPEMVDLLLHCLRCDRAFSFNDHRAQDSCWPIVIRWHHARRFHRKDCLYTHAFRREQPGLNHLFRSHSKPFSLRLIQKSGPWPLIGQSLGSKTHCAQRTICLPVRMSTFSSTGTARFQLRFCCSALETQVHFSVIFSMMACTVKRTVCDQAISRHAQFLGTMQQRWQWVMSMPTRPLSEQSSHYFLPETSTPIWCTTRLTCKKRCSLILF